MAANRPFWPPSHSFCPDLARFELIRAISEMDIWYKFEAIDKKMLSESCYQENLPIRIGCRSAILNLIKLNFFIVYPYLKVHVLFNSNGLAIWSGFLDITHIQK